MQAITFNINFRDEFTRQHLQDIINSVDVLTKMSADVPIEQDDLKTIIDPKILESKNPSKGNALKDIVIKYLSHYQEYISTYRVYYNQLFIDNVKASNRIKYEVVVEKLQKMIYNIEKTVPVLKKIGNKQSVTLDDLNNIFPAPGNDIVESQLANYNRYIVHSNNKFTDGKATSKEVNDMIKNIGLNTVVTETGRIWAAEDFKILMTKENLASLHTTSGVTIYLFVFIILVILMSGTHQIMMI